MTDHNLRRLNQVKMGAATRHLATAALHASPSIGRKDENIFILLDNLAAIRAFQTGKSSSSHRNFAAYHCRFSYTNTHFTCNYGLGYTLTQFIKCQGKCNADAKTKEIFNIG